MARVTVLEWERVLAYVDGRLRRELGPGRHRYRRGRTFLVHVDLRPQVLVVPAQEVLTSDGLTVKVSATVTWRIADAAAHQAAARQPEQLLYAAVQAGIRDGAAGRSLEELVAGRDTLTAAVRQAADAAAARLGAAVEDAAVRDVMLPGELRRAAAETALARERGRAELERARGEAAALRTMANAARLLEEHPALLHLRTLQAAGPGSTVVLTPPA